MLNDIFLKALKKKHLASPCVLSDVGHLKLLNMQFHLSCARYERTCFKDVTEDP